MSRPATTPSALAAGAFALLLCQSAPSAAEPEPKVDCTNPTSTVEMNSCADRDFATADAALNATYRMALKRIHSLASDPPFDAARFEAALRRSQRAWIAFRDAECKDHVPMFWGGGTGTTVAVLGCMIVMTKSRTRELEDAYSER